ncbi:MAG: hypothetical protein QNK26_09140 [Moritella sp.]|uniref:hypothetical protein n=1 Tax=Moritella sp. TaxID=78556 RepID=UPI0029A7A7CC|nr:hypothetical protein [Moritella sp.]MDX2320744.1 hypothetical protein [Moritella sp.]
MRHNKHSNSTHDLVNKNVLIDNFAAINDIYNPDIESTCDIDIDSTCDTDSNTAVVEVSLAAKMNFVRQIWLAGLGAYSHSIDELNTAGEKSSMIFEDLLRQGEKVDSTFKLHATAEHISLHGLEKLIQRTYTKLTGFEGDKITQLNNKLDALIAELEDKKQTT